MIKRNGNWNLQAIEVKRLQHSDGSVSMKAFCAAGSVTRGRQYGTEYDEDAWQVAELLIKKLEWPGEYSMGVLKNGNYVVVRTITKETTC